MQRHVTSRNVTPQAPVRKADPTDTGADQLDLQLRAAGGRESVAGEVPTIAD